MTASRAAVAAAFDQLDAAQGHVCKLCGRLQVGGKRLAVDHCHDDTGHIRDLLCNPCNAGMGGFRDNPAMLRKAADYLEAHAEYNRLKPLLGFTIPLPPTNPINPSPADQADTSDNTEAKIK